MPKAHRPWLSEFRCHMVKLVRSGRTPWELSREINATATRTRTCVRQVDRYDGLHQDDAVASGREEPTRLRRTAPGTSRGSPRSITDTCVDVRNAWP